MGAENSHGTAVALRFLELLSAGAPAWRFEEFVLEARAKGADRETFEYLGRAKRLALEVGDRVSRGRQREAELTGLVDVVRELSRSPHPGASLDQIVRRARLLMNSDVVYVALLDESGEQAVISAVDGAVTPELIGLEVPLGKGPGGSVAKHQGPFSAADYLTEYDLDHDPVVYAAARAEGVHAILSVPVWAENEQLGVLGVGHRRVHEFLPDEVTLLRSLADIAAVAVKSGRLLAKMRAGEPRGDQRPPGRFVGSAEPRAARIQRRLLQLALDGAEMNELLDHCARELGGSLAVYDRSGEVVASSGPGLPPHPGDLERSVANGNAGGRPVALADGTWLMTLTARSDPGWLLHRPDEPMNPGQLELLPTVANVVSMLMALWQDDSAGQPWRDDLLEDLIGIDDPAEAAVARARRLSVRLDRTHVVVVARPDGPVDEKAKAWAASWAQRHQGLKMARDNCLVLLLPGDDPAAMADEVSAGLSAVLERTVTVGAAGPTEGPESVQRFHQEAMRCVEALIAMGGVGRTACARDLGFLGLLFAEDYDVTEFVNKIIGPVIEYDTQRFTVLVETLEAYFQAACSPTRAAELLYVHPNTVSRRLERITQLLGRDWQEPDHALELQLALRLHRTRYASQAQAEVQAPDVGHLPSRGR
ncbi:helix-turn-helix domain-containing protein [Streptomyces phaeochromogenes]|uniref:helix-turn-helix domain-containing protein n=1 Tax=Streptomyces phaeochromogenes TaxID=1923 RepID=UPI00324BEAE7